MSGHAVRVATFLCFYPYSYTSVRKKATGLLQILSRVVAVCNCQEVE